MGRYRNQYTKDDEQKMLQFLSRQLDKGNADAWKPRGNRLWEKAERLKVTDHPFQSMRDHFRRQLSKNLKAAGAEVGESYIRNIKKKLKEHPPLSLTGTEDDLEIIEDASEQSSGSSRPSATSTPNPKRRRVDLALDFDEADDHFLHSCHPRARSEQSAEEVVVEEEKENEVEDEIFVVNDSVDDELAKGSGDNELAEKEPTDGSDDTGALADKPPVDESIENQIEEPTEENDNTGMLADKSPLYKAIEDQVEKEAAEGDGNPGMLTDKSLLYKAIEDHVKKEPAGGNDNPEALADNPLLYESMENQWTQQTEQDENLELAVVADEAVVSSDESFESASAVSPRFRQFVANADVENRQEFERKIMFLRELSSRYNIDFPELQDVLGQLRMERTVVDLITVEITVWKKKRET